MGWVELVTLLGMLSGLAIAAATFRPSPMWFRAATVRPGPSPRQRRWIGAGLSLLMAGQLVGLQLEGDTPWWLVNFTAIGGGFACILVGVFRKPTTDELQRRARMLGSDETGTA